MKHKKETFSTCCIMRHQKENRATKLLGIRKKKIHNIKRVAKKKNCQHENANKERGRLSASRTRSYNLGNVYT